MRNVNKQKRLYYTQKLPF